MDFKHQQAGETAHPVNVSEALWFAGLFGGVQAAQESPSGKRKASFSRKLRAVQ
jgi:hypothetical protein